MTGTRRAERGGAEAAAARAAPASTGAAATGGVVTAIDVETKDPLRRVVRVDGRIRARLPVTDVETLGLVVGRSWTARLDGAVAAARRRDAARRTALRLLARRDHASGELIERLGRGAHDEADARAVVAELVAGGWIDDAAWARAYAREIVARKPAGVALIVRKLRDRRIEPALAEEIARETLAGTDPLDAALPFARTLLRGRAGEPGSGAARRIASALARRGIDEDVIRETLDRLALSEPPHTGDPP